MKYSNQTLYLRTMKRKSFLIKLTRILIVFFLLFIWELLTRKGIINSFIYSSPSKIYLTIKKLCIEGNLFSHIFTTLYEVLISFLLGGILGILIAVIFYEYPTFSKIFEPFLVILNALPKVALGPIILIIFGANMKSIIIMALLINLIVTTLSMYNGFLNTDKIKIKLFKTFNANKFQTLTKLIIPSSYITIISSLKLNISLTLIGVITGEFLSCQKGIGYLIMYGSQIFDLDLVISGVFILLIFSYLLYFIISKIEKKLIRED